MQNLPSHRTARTEHQNRVPVVHGSKRRTTVSAVATGFALIQYESDAINDTVGTF